MRNPSILDLCKKRSTALGLLMQIVNRASNTQPGDPDLKEGEAFIGDWEKYCKSEKCYRTDKKLLEKWQIATFKGTSKGTIARLTNSAYFDLKWKKGADTETTKATDKGRTRGGQGATNIEIRNKKYINNTSTKETKWGNELLDLVARESEIEIAKKRRGQ